MESVMVKFEELPEDCVADMLSLVTPRDLCALSLVSKGMCSIASSDVVWERFLPSDYESIISGSSAAWLQSASSKKDIFFTLSHHPIIIDNGRRSFQLDKNTGKKCCMLAARDLLIVWGDTPQYWKWISLPESRFNEVAMLRLVWWLEIRGKTSTKILSPNTQYAVYLVFKLRNSYGFDYYPAELSVGIHGDRSSTKKACLEPRIIKGRNQRDYLEMREFLSDEEWLGLPRPTKRSDGWWEIEMGEFFNSGLEDGQLEMSIVQIDANPKGGLIIQGIEIRPKFFSPLAEEKEDVEQDEAMFNEEEDEEDVDEGEVMFYEEDVGEEEAMFGEEEEEEEDELEDEDGDVSIEDGG